MELFHNNGHLTKEGFEALVQDQLDELQSLEVSEHLSYCTPCLEHYLELLETAPLLCPEAPMKDTIMKRIGRRAKRIIFSRYATVAVAACLVLAVWGSGYFSSALQGDREQNSFSLSEFSSSQHQAPTEPGPSLATQMNRAAAGLPDKMNQLFGGWLPQNTPPEQTNKEAAQDATSPTDDSTADSSTSHSNT